MAVNISRLANNPIITTASSASLGNNVNGPSLIRVPQWVDDPLGRYYLYFAHHKGKHIRLAYADDVGGPWHIHEPGALSLADSLYPEEIVVDRLPERLRDRAEFMYAHIASPEAIVLDSTREIRLYYHGMLENGIQASRVAASRDGLHFEARPEVITRPYLRVFPWDGAWYGMAMPGVFYRSADGLTGFEVGPTLFNADMRHAALMIRNRTLYVFWTQVGHTPERILLSTIDISGDWSTWQADAPIEVLRPEFDWEGADCPLAPSKRGAIEHRVNQLRDPAIFEEDGNAWLLYAIAGEAGLAIAELTEE